MDSQKNYIAKIAYTEQVMTSNLIPVPEKYYVSNKKGERVGGGGGYDSSFSKKKTSTNNNFCQSSKISFITKPLIFDLNL